MAAITPEGWTDQWQLTLLRFVLTGGLLLLAYAVRQYQKKLVEGAAAEINEELHSAVERSTIATEETIEPPPAPPLLSVAELDEEEYIAAERAVKQSEHYGAERSMFQMMLETQHPQPRTFDLVREKEVAQVIVEKFATLQKRWTADTSVSAEIRELVLGISESLASLPAELRGDRVSISQCMSICCTAVLKHDGLYVLEAIRLASPEIADKCQGIIETTVPFIWAT